jgi:signal peptidase II
MRWLWLTFAVLVLDQTTKGLASAWLGFHEPVALAPFLNLTLTHNTGAAFSFLSGAGGWQRWFFAGIALVVSAGLVLWLRRLGPGQRALAAALALVLGGALGNLIDRLVLGYVVDFVDLHYAGWHWPAFNVADSAITVGVAILLWDAFFGSGGRDEPATPPPAARDPGAGPAPTDGPEGRR